MNWRRCTYNRAYLPGVSHLIFFVRIFSFANIAWPYRHWGKLPLSMKVRNWDSDRTSLVLKRFHCRITQWFNESANVKQRYLLTFWDMIPCILVEVYRRFGKTYCLHFKAEEYAKQAELFVFVDTFLAEYAASRPRKHYYPQPLQWDAYLSNVHSFNICPVAIEFRWTY
jgi:hypothetical protein